MVGGIASANSEQGIIENCENYASVSGARCIGGISSWSTGNLRNNINFGQISNAVETGWNLQIEQIGGITGWGENSITQCENYGEIRSITTNVNTTQKGVGGIIGSGYSGEVKKCNNFANVSGSGSNASGIIGFAANKAGENFIVSKCYNTGNISGAFAGGISGWSSYMQIQDCYNVGEIKGSSHTGGIIGWTSQKGSIINSYNIGKVTGTPTNLVGGILGRYNNVPTLTNCYNLNTSSAYAIGDDNGAWGTLDNIWEGHVETKTEEGMKGLADTLGSSWIDDIDNVNNGYPVLK